jgi:hypothetical protein
MAQIVLLHKITFSPVLLFYLFVKVMGVTVRVAPKGACWTKTKQVV